MNAAVIVLGIIAVAMLGLQYVLLRWADARVSIEVKARQDERALYDRGLDGLRAQQVIEIERIRETYERMIEAQAGAHGKALEHLMNLVQFGMPTRQEAVTEEREPDAATRVARRVTEETITRAIADLRKQYAAINVPVTDAELDAEARSIIMGERWTPPASLAGMLKD